jgi:hypothetical protein
MPLDASSEHQRRHRLNRGGDRQLNRALHVIALARIHHADVLSLVLGSHGTYASVEKGPTVVREMNPRWAENALSAHHTNADAPRVNRAMVLRRRLSCCTRQGSRRPMRWPGLPGTWIRRRAPTFWSGLGC